MAAVAIKRMSGSDDTIDEAVLTELRTRLGDHLITLKTGLTTRSGRFGTA